MTDRTAGSVHLMADDPSGSTTVDPSTKDNDAKASDVTVETVATDSVTDEPTGTPAADAPDAAEASGEVPDETRADDDTGMHAKAEEPDEPTQAKPEPRPDPEPVPQGRSVADVERGTRFADRYRLEDRLSSNGKSATWRAVDEKLRRAVGIHIVVAGSDHARSVMAAARAAALVGDPRFVQVLDAAEEDGLVYVVKEWLPDADNLASLLATNPLPPHEAYEMVRSIADAMAVAHRAGLSHLRLDPENVLRMHTGQYKIVGLSVEAALYGHDTTDAALDDTRAIGSLLYACLARRWPEAERYGLPRAPRNGDRLLTPGQVKAHVHGPLEAVAMRALGYEYKHQPPFEAPEDVVAAIAAIPTVLPPEPDPVVSAAGAQFDDEYTPTAVLSPKGLVGGPPPSTPTGFHTAPPPALGGGFGRLLKVVVAIIVLVAVVLATWQIAAHVNKKDEAAPSPSASGGQPSSPQAPAPVPAPNTPLEIKRGIEFDPQGEARGETNPRLTFDGNPDTTWRTKTYSDTHLQPYRDGVGIVYDFGAPVDVRSVNVDLLFGDPGTTFEVRALPAGTALPDVTKKGTQNSFSTVLGTGQSGSGKTVTVTAEKPVKSQYVLIWFTDLARVFGDSNGGVGLKTGITEIRFTS
ncbi:protein kinase family protein [Yinghuangia seranimata]|uniref:protein kinase family protein n=1 Tax=Yinghuangia seranimata TaxID=408067 RepID=UPI00248BE5FF|nr:protein kinase family protein [Yinghuangia seranimata]MDI2130474.1 protein kinase family protein [Yinghuangia seranimata]